MARYMHKPLTERRYIVQIEKTPVAGEPTYTSNYGPYDDLSTAHWVQQYIVGPRYRRRSDRDVKVTILATNFRSTRRCMAL